MPSRRACLVLGLGLGALLAPLAHLATTVLAGGSWLNPKES